MTDLVQKLVGALEETLLFCETFSNRWDGQTGAHPFGMVERARAALSEAKAGGWQSIETAPKDGTVVLLCRGERVTAGNWEPERWPTQAEYHSSTGEYLGQFETGECIDAWWPSQDGGFSEDEPPTKWQPLPNPPKGEV